MLKKAAVTAVAAGSLAVVGAGPALAHDGPDVKADLTQHQTCTYKALVPVNLALLNMDSSVGSFSCVQSGKIG